MTQAGHRGFQRLAAITTVSVWFLIALGGVVRVTESGLGCPDWPLCYGRLLPPPEFTAIVEYTHRTVAALVSLFIVLTTLGAWRRYRQMGWVVVPATVSLALLVVQILLGAVTVILELPPEIVVAHLAVALAILALLIVAAVVARYPDLVAKRRLAGSLSGLLWMTVPALFLLMLSGALVTGSGAAAVCPSFPLCLGNLIPPQGFPLQRIHMLHRLWMVILAVLVALVVVHANRGQRPRVVRRWSWILAGLFATQVLIGIGQVTSGLPTVLRASHVAFAAAVWGALVVLATLCALHRRSEIPAGEEEESTEPLGQTARVLGHYLRLTKPIIVALLLFTTLTAMIVAAGGLPRLGVLLTTLTGGALAAAGANTINQYLERDIDQLMTRTRRRPIPAGDIKPEHALVFGLALSAASFVLLATLVNLLSALLAMAGILYYVLVYTMWLKRSTPLNVVVGGAAGAIPPLVGWAAIHNRVDLLGLFLFAIIFYWTPPHTWALTLLVKNDYARASVPMLPVAKGERATYVRILLYTMLLVALTLLLTPLRLMGLFYLTAALVLGGWHIVVAIQVWQQKTKAASRRLYKYSTMYLALLFLAMVFDRALVG